MLESGRSGLQKTEGRMNEWTPEGIIRSWARAYREGPPEHRFPSDPHAEFFPVDLEAAADAIDALRAELATARAALEKIAGSALPPSHSETP